MRLIIYNYSVGLLVIGLLFAASVHAATVSHLGNEIDFGESWRSTNVAKSNSDLDPSGDNAWGSDGYFVALANPSVANLQPVFFANHTGQYALFTIALCADAGFVLTVIFDNQNPGLGSQYDVHASVFEQLRQAHDTNGTTTAISGASGPDLTWSFASGLGSTEGLSGSSPSYTLVLHGSTGTGLTSSSGATPPRHRGHTKAGSPVRPDPTFAVAPSLSSRFPLLTMRHATVNAFEFR